MQPSDVRIKMIVYCPESFGPTPPYTGMVMGFCDEIRRNHQGQPYRWVTVRDRKTGRESVWPSNLLSDRPLITNTPKIRWGFRRKEI